ncbi:hypothetical protein GCM10010332_05680 [Streptomyces albogriseolus]|nr:hypothetical protein GCM10010332_05680 [Streptomyces albogriseolus]
MTRVKNARTSFHMLRAAAHGPLAALHFALVRARGAVPASETAPVDLARRRRRVVT